MRSAVARTAAMTGLLIPILLAVLPSQADATAAPAGPCQSARQALQAGQYQLASTLYTKDTDQPATRSCGRAGLTATSALSAAGQLLAVGLTAQAGTEIVQALDAVPLLTLPADLMPKGTARQDETLAETLDANGFHTQAVAVLDRVISADPSLSRSLDADARNILGLIRQPLYLRVWHVIWDLISSPEAIFCWLIVVVALVTGLWQQLRRRLYMQQFTAADGIKSGDTFAVTLRSFTREELGRLARDSARSPGGRRLRLHLAGPYDDRDKIDFGPLVGTLPAGLQQLYQVITLLTSRLGARSSLLTGRLLSATTVHLSLKSIVRKPQGETIMDHDKLGFPADGDFQPGPVPPPPPGPPGAQRSGHRGRMQQLALAAAAWIILVRYGRRKISLGGTTNWDSYVAFAAGCTWEEAGTSPRHQDRARACYLLARRDPENTAAAINLAAMELAEDLKSPPQVPIEDLSWYQTLTAIVEATDRRGFLPFRRGRRDLQWYRARYLLAMGLRDLMDVAPPASPEVREYFADKARELTADVAIELERRARSPRWWLPKEFVHYGRTAAITLLARQVMTWTNDPAQVVTTSWSAGFTKRTIGSALQAIRNGYVDKDTSAKLAEFPATAGLVVDDQSEYNLARYRRRRFEICETAINSYQAALDGNPPGTSQRNDWRDGILRYMDRLEEQAQEELTLAARYERQVEYARDPFLATEIRTLQESQRLRRTPPGPENRHHPAYGTPDQQPPPRTPPPLDPPTDEPAERVLPLGRRLPDVINPDGYEAASLTRPDSPVFSDDYPSARNITPRQLPQNGEEYLAGTRRPATGTRPPANFVPDVKPESRVPRWLHRMLQSVGLAR
jgi:hypothetical protein